MHSQGAAVKREWLRGNVAAMIAMTLAMAAFVCNDAVMKLVAAEVPLAQAIFVRGLIAVTLISALTAMTGNLGAWRRGIEPRIVARGVTEIGATFLFLTGLLHTPLPNATAIVNAAPLMMTVMAVVFLGERVGARRWSAILAGFVGVLLIVRPGVEGFNIHGLVILGATVAIATRDLLTRDIDRRIPSIIVTLCAAVMVAAAAGLVTAASGKWAPVSWANLAALAGAAVLIFIGFQFIIVALRIGEISAIAPFRYAVIVWSLLLGYLVWGDVPPLAAFAGIALITASGLYLFHREYRVGRGIVTNSKRDSDREMGQ